MRRLLQVLIAALALAGCSRRERSNPLDPANPQTGGRPEGFVALAGYASVRLQWIPQPALAIDGFRLSRLVPGDSLFRPLGPTLARDAPGFLDSGLRNGERYRYQLDYVVRGRPANAPASDEATPGALRPWVADAGANALLRLTPDGRHVAARFTDAGGVQSLAVDPATSAVWTSADFDGLVTVRDPLTAVPVRITGIAQPFTMALSPFDHSAWICDLAGALSHRNPDGSAASPGRLDLFDGPTGVAVNPADYTVWVCENGGGRVRHLAANGTPIGATFVARPSRVAADSSTNLCWVTSLTLGRIWRVNPDGSLRDSSNAAAGPIGVAIDWRFHRAWIADAAGNRVIALDPGTMAALFTVPNLGEPRDVAVDPGTGDAWVVARAERSVVRISRDGTILQRVGGLSDPYEVRLDPGGP